MAAVADAFAREAPWPAVRSLWSARFAKAAGWFLHGETERRARGRPLAREVRGRRAMEGLARPFAVKARRGPDRPDAGRRLRDLRLQVGQLPSAAEAKAFHLQLPLEGAIAEAGGFDGLAAGRAGHLELIGVLGCEIRAIDPAEIATTWDAAPYAGRLLPGPGQRLHGAAAAAAADLRGRLRPPVAQGRVGGRGSRTRGARHDRRGRGADPRGAAGRVELGGGQCRLGQDPGADRPGGAAAARRHRPARRCSASPTPRRPRRRCRRGCSGRSARWAMLDDAALRAALAAGRAGRAEGAIPAARLARARTLFARALETPGGLKIQTIHAFCEALLRRFPLEAGVAPQFGVLEDRQARCAARGGARRAGRGRAGALRRCGPLPRRQRAGRAPAGDRPPPRRLRRARFDAARLARCARGGAGPDHRRAARRK